MINSPTLTSTKFWPGELGKFANFAVVFAKLILEGHSIGVMPFMV